VGGKERPQVAGQVGVQGQPGFAVRRPAGLDCFQVVGDQFVEPGFASTAVGGMWCSWFGLSEGL